ncbi:unnamed protein product [Calypogeia fissa]
MVNDLVEISLVEEGHLPAHCPELESPLFKKLTLLEKLKTLYSDFESLPADRIVPTVGLKIGRIEAHKSKLIFWDLGA